MESVTKYKNLHIHFREKSMWNGECNQNYWCFVKMESDKLDNFLYIRIVQETEEARKQITKVKGRHGELKKLEEDIVWSWQNFTMNYWSLWLTNELPFPSTSLTIAKRLYHRTLTKQKIIRMICAFLCLMLLIISISASTSGSETDQQIEFVEEHCLHKP